MSEYNKVFWELRYEVWKVSFLNAFLSGALAFFICNILFTIIKVSVLYSLIPAIIVFGFSLYRGLRRYTLRRIEEGNPEVAEILRTAHDNSSKDDLMVHALFIELLEKMETVSAGVFIDGQKTTMKLAVIALLAFTPLLITAYVPSLTLDNPLVNLPLPRVLGTQAPLAPILPITEDGERDISGEKDVLRLGDEELDITTAAGGGFDFGKPQDATEKQFKYNDYPIDIVAEQTDAGSGGVESSESGLINDYSCKTKGTC